MKILFAASEAVPFAKTGGLADVAGSLPPALGARGHDVRLVMPRYGSIDPDRFGLKRVASFFVPLGSWRERCEVLQGSLDENVIAYFISQDTYFDRPELYQNRQGDFPDNAERFTFFSRAILELCRTLNFAPDIVHTNDWQTGLASFYFSTLYRGSPPFMRTKTVFTVHNLGYQGNFPREDMRYIGDAWNHFNPEGFEFWGDISFLKAGLVYSDVITTVSRTYSREIQTEEFGFGLEGVLARRAPDLYGIVNGIDYGAWDPAGDQAITRRYSAARPGGKALCRDDLRKRAGLPADGGPVIAMVSRLVDQKGFDILTDALPDILDMGVQFIVLGTGDERYERLLSDAAERYPEQVRVLLRYDEQLAKIIYAGCDLFVMPSLYEPCGLGQLIALRYGAVPVARRTGGLADTIRDYDEGPARGTGFLFNDYSALALTDAIRRAVEVFSEPKAWRRLVRSGMQQDFSWESSAREYEKVYRKALRKK